MSALATSVFQSSYVRPARMADIAHLHARKADEQELWSSFRHTPQEAARIGIEVCDASSVFLYGDLAGIFGVVPHPVKHGIGCPWAILTFAAELHPLAFLRASRKEALKMYQQFYYLENFVDARNTASIKWLAWLGFTLYEAESFGKDELPFHRFTWSCDV